MVAIAVLVWAKYAFGTGFRVFGTLCTVKVATGHAGGFAITYREYQSEAKTEDGAQIHFMKWLFWVFVTLFRPRSNPSGELVHSNTPQKLF